jgi:DNA mismatch repair protein MutS2
MISAKTLKKIEYDRILEEVKNRAVLDTTREEILSFNPVSDLSEAEFLLKKTEEAYNLLYKYSIGGIYFFHCVFDELDRANKGGTLSIKEILSVTAVLKSARIIQTALQSVNDESIKIIPEICSRLFINSEFEKEIASANIVTDTVSPKLLPNYTKQKSI